MTDPKVRYPLSMENVEAIGEYLRAAGPSRWVTELMGDFDKALAAVREGRDESNEGQNRRQAG